MESLGIRLKKIDETRNHLLAEIIQRFNEQKA